MPRLFVLSVFHYLWNYLLCAANPKGITGYWPSNVRVCGLWFVPMEWQFSCNKCRDLSIQFSERYLHPKDELCSTYMDLQCFLMTSTSDVPIFIGFSSVGSMGFLRNSRAFLLVLQTVIQITNYRFILFTAGYEPLDSAIQMLAEALSCFDRKICSEDGVLFWDQLFCFSGTIPYNWLFQRCAVAVHHGGR
ncbi:hypothetical protein IFM89_002785 [Coptis chinensis]|uniref:Uncharacterized protein n=1 Tax=Coptis chinensis TaxID=261450 RepID=A0A835HQU5_9MAGN|nr:hypothetical protein IFM89_002785 [Coptis chinensis]